ncbi:ATP-binding cassette domain-containing protein [Kitasatospora sp. NPDC058190]|uniref:ATP-binding cassette domain-containing protein n=1 Tax=Kitasatospora sp. NPDC058190 TaxID=3346371 RepID=UPI0036DB2C2D
MVGEYGSGKTTLVKLLNRFHQPDSGRIIVDGVDLARHDSAGWHARTSAAFQDFGRYHAVFSETVGLGGLPHLDDHERPTSTTMSASPRRRARPRPPASSVGCPRA